MARRQQQVLELAYGQGLTTRQIAEHLGISERSARRDLAGVRAELRRLSSQDLQHLAQEALVTIQQSYLRRKRELSAQYHALEGPGTPAEARSGPGPVERARLRLQMLAEDRENDSAYLAALHRLGVVPRPLAEDPAEDDGVVELDEDTLLQLAAEIEADRRRALGQPDGPTSAPEWP